MNGTTEAVLVVLHIAATHVALPAAIVWGWVRWTKRAKERRLPAILSLAGFTLATASALLAISMVLYARAIGGFEYYDPRLLRIYRWGLLLSLAGVVLGIGGVWRSSPLRWHAPACSAGTLLFWLVAMSLE